MEEEEGKTTHTIVGTIFCYYEEVVSFCPFEILCQFQATISGPYLQIMGCCVRAREGLVIRVTSRDGHKRHLIWAG